MASFEYITNSFYIEDRGNAVRNFFYGNKRGINLAMMSGTSTDEDQFSKKAAINHELNHYIQDLSVNACITEGFFLDYLSAYARELSKVDGVKFPLIDNGGHNRSYNQSLSSIPSDAKDLLRCFYEMHDVYNYIFLDYYVKPDKEDYRYGATLDPTFVENNHTISYKYLLESYAYHKGYLDSFLKETTEGLKIAHNAIRKDKVFPLVFRDGNIGVREGLNLKRDFIWQSQYQMVDFLMLISCIPASVKDYLNYCEKEFPENYFNSIAMQVHSAQKVILETALNIPSVNFIMGSIQRSHYDKDAFSPVHRFYKIIKTIRDNHGYPDAIQGEDFFITFHDWCARLNNWPTFEESLGSIAKGLIERAKMGEECITNFQIKALREKVRNYGKFVQQTPMEILSLLGLPVIFSNEDGLQVEQLLGNVHYNPSGLLTFYNVWFKTAINKYIKTEDNTPPKEFYSAIMNNQIGAIREILSRLFSKAAGKAFIYDGCFRCPLANNGCPRATEECNEFRNVNDVISKCEDRVFRMGDIHFYQENESGNTPDCMFLNYLLDYNYDLKSIK